MRTNDEVQHLYSFVAIYPDAHWGKPAWFWMPAAQSSVFCVCVFLVGRSLVCSTCVWHYCDKAAQPLWGDGECQRLESRSEQLPNIWWNEKHTRWMAGLLTPQRGSRAVGGGQVKPQLCVWNITLSLFSFCFLLNVRISTHILKHCFHWNYQVSFLRLSHSRWDAWITLSGTFTGENSPFIAKHFWKLFVELTLQKFINI